MLKKKKIHKVVWKDGSVILKCNRECTQMYDNSVLPISPIVFEMYEDKLYEMGED
jgi:hypothetical protein